MSKLGHNGGRLLILQVFTSITNISEWQSDSQKKILLYGTRCEAVFTRYLCYLVQNHSGVSRRCEVGALTD